ncbi:hypothetical protein [Propionispora vibrioides]|uniref:CAAX protease self-immunity n=1 Tax=Propionispora vibrioides TaxID=112903 RepID=A0A1H8TPP3_9FIRM|nr:hypothetical protein [Propionispora vibrioides]SEO92831.1 hypothetical protein SAMN04490178_10752 [Propionispora vibrioides]
MAYLIAVLMAALSFIVNKALLTRIGVKTVITYSPVIEESAKTLLSFYLGADIFLTHVVFGVIEAGYDWLTGGRGRSKAALLSVAGHSLFGGATVVTLRETGQIGLALTGAIVLHLAWNLLAVKRLRVS